MKLMERSTEGNICIFVLDKRKLFLIHLLLISVPTFEAESVKLLQRLVRELGRATE